MGSKSPNFETHADYIRARDFYERSIGIDPDEVRRKVKLDKIHGAGTYEKVQRLREEQNCLCAICGKPQNSSHEGMIQHLALDHCHETGKLRGLLCGLCNQGIGLFRDSPHLLRLAVDYLRREGYDPRDYR